VAVWLVRDCVLFTSQVTANFGAGYYAPKTTETLINYTACWQLVFIHIRLFVIYLAFNFLSVKLHQPIHEAQIYFVFLSVGKLKTVLKGGY
jgi:hypothetical protein